MVLIWETGGGGGGGIGTGGGGGGGGGEQLVSEVAADPELNTSAGPVGRVTRLTDRLMDGENTA